MNRVIKFRAWVTIGDNNEIKGMIEEPAIYGANHDGNLGCFREQVERICNNCGYTFDGDYFMNKETQERLCSLEEFNGSAYDEWVFFDGGLMQFSGLLDKNGKEIFEDDVIKWSFKEEPNKEYTDVVKWEECGFFIEGGAPLSVATEISEVIGNIYENPELLRGLNSSEGGE